MNRLYCGGNLAVMREHLAGESVDLVYPDPPFNSNADYNVLFKEKDGTQAAKLPLGDAGALEAPASRISERRPWAPRRASGACKTAA